MESKLFQVLGRSAGIGGISLGVFLLLFRGLVAKDILPKAGLRPDQSYHLLLVFMYLTFGIALVGIVAWGIASKASKFAVSALLIFGLCLGFIGIRFVSADSENDSGESGLAGSEVRFVGQSISLDQLPAEMLQPIAGEGDLAKALARRGSLFLDHSTLVITPLGVSRSLTVHTLTLLNGSKIETNGNDLTLYASKIVGNGGNLDSFSDQDANPPVATAGKGHNGRDGGHVVLCSSRGLDGSLTINLRGQNGGAGAPGAVGSGGTQGPRGSNAVQGMVDCRSGGGDGGQGGQGNIGSPGTDGGNGGNGGSLNLCGNLATSRERIFFSAPPGVGGLGGAGGFGGPGGQGGEGGSGSASCSGGRAGQPGPPGPQGERGNSGADGVGGKVSLDGLEITR